MLAVAPTVTNINAQLAIARRHAEQARQTTTEAYEHMAVSSAKLETRIKSNRFHIKLEKAIGGRSRKAKK